MLRCAINNKDLTDMDAYEQANLTLLCIKQTIGDMRKNEHILMKIKYFNSQILIHDSCEKIYKDTKASNGLVNKVDIFEIYQFCT